MLRLKLRVRYYELRTVLLRMNFLSSIFFSGCLLTLCGVSFAQDCLNLGVPPPASDPAASCKMFGRTRVLYYRSPKMSAAYLEVYLLGKREDIAPTENAGIRVLKDNLFMTVSFRAENNFIPNSAHIVLTSFATDKSKYKHNNRFAIFVDGVEVYFGKPDLGRSVWGIGETFYIVIKYADF